MSVKDRFQECEECDEPFSFPSQFFEGPVRASFEDEEVPIPMELMEIYQQFLTHESILASPPADFFRTIPDFSYHRKKTTSCLHFSKTRTTLLTPY